MNQWSGIIFMCDYFFFFNNHQHTSNIYQVVIVCRKIYYRLSFIIRNLQNDRKRQVLSLSLLSSSSPPLYRWENGGLEIFLSCWLRGLRCKTQASLWQNHSSSPRFRLYYERGIWGILTKNISPVHGFEGPLSL